MTKLILPDLDPLSGEKHEDCSLLGLKSSHAMVFVLPEILALPGTKRVSMFLTANLAFSDQFSSYKV